MDKLRERLEGSKRGRGSWRAGWIWRRPLLGGFGRFLVLRTADMEAVEEGLHGAT